MVLENRATEPLSGADRRRHERYELMVQVSVRHAAEVYVMKVRNISKSGIYVATACGEFIDRALPGDVVELDIFLTGEVSNATVKARIVRTEKTTAGAGPGFAAEFEGLPEGTWWEIIRMAKRTSMRAKQKPQTLPHSGSAGDPKDRYRLDGTKDR